VEGVGHVCETWAAVGMEPHFMGRRAGEMDTALAGPSLVDWNRPQFSRLLSNGNAAALAQEVVAPVTYRLWSRFKMKPSHGPGAS